jgi:hypothetical protein
VIPQRLGTLAAAATLQLLLVRQRFVLALPSLLPTRTRVRWQEDHSTTQRGAKNAPLRHFYTINDHFTKAGSGQTWEKEMRFLQENRVSRRETQPGVCTRLHPPRTLLLLCVSLMNNEDGGFGSSHAAKMSARSSLSRREDRRVQQRLL